MVIPAADDPALSVPVEIRPARREVTQLIQVDPESPAFDRCIEPHGVRFPAFHPLCATVVAEAPTRFYPFQGTRPIFGFAIGAILGRGSTGLCRSAPDGRHHRGYQKGCSGNGFDNAGHVHSPSADRPG